MFITIVAPNNVVVFSASIFSPKSTDDIQFVHHKDYSIVFTDDRPVVRSEILVDDNGNRIGEQVIKYYPEDNRKKL
jgi:hypothetical protein